VVEAVEHERVARGAPLEDPLRERGTGRDAGRAEELRNRDAAHLELTGERDGSVERLGGVVGQAREGDDQVGFGHPAMDARRREQRLTTP
jgi:hypothetical protein